MVPKPLRVKLEKLKEFAEQHPMTSTRANGGNLPIDKFSVVYGPEGQISIIVFTVENHDDGVYWHLTIDREDQYPTMPEILGIASIFFGEDKSTFVTLPNPDTFFSPVNSVDVWCKERGNIIVPC